MNLAEITEKMSELKAWSLEGNVITKDFEFKDFKEALDFVNKIGEIAEKHEHHPDIVILYNKVRLSLTTHSAKELTEKDFEVAKEIDGIE
jgi:4a-hydroxytetrahydrobiopterin dehydratase